uniref:Uncharacterized protein n=1 Tax=Panagrolaimus sp. ES5 TaxID=591445 RepID=A0AC34FE43_9BILA
MDLSDLQNNVPSTELSNQKRKANDSMNDGISKKSRFMATYRHQNFPFRDSLINYITKNPSSAKVYQKMVKCCKYFFIKNPILVAENLCYHNKKWNITLGKETLGLISSKLWITNAFSINCIPIKNSNLVSSIFPKLYQCGAKKLNLCDQIFSFKDFCFLSSNVEELQLYHVIVKNDDGSIVPFEKLFEVIPKIKVIFFVCDTSLPQNITSKTFNELLKIPHFLKLKVFRMENIPETFDLDAFYGYMKKNKLTKFNLKFDSSISNAHKNRLEGIIDEIIGELEHDYMPPLIHYSGYNELKYLVFCVFVYANYALLEMSS